MGERVRTEKIGVDRKKEAVAKGPRPPNRSMVKGMMAIWEEFSSSRINIMTHPFASVL